MTVVLPVTHTKPFEESATVLVPLRAMTPLPPPSNLSVPAPVKLLVVLKGFTVAPVSSTVAPLEML